MWGIGIGYIAGKHFGTLGANAQSVLMYAKGLIELIAIKPPPPMTRQKQSKLCARYRVEDNR